MGGMKTWNFGEAKRWLRLTGRSHRIGVPILMYHRVHKATSDPWGICVSPPHFNEQMERLSRYFSPVPLGELVALLTTGQLPERAVAVTFDDGYADNLWNAKPILRRWGVPATVFVASGYLGQPQGFWWDELYRVLLQAGRLPRTLELNLDGALFKWNLEESATFTEQDCRRYQAWRAEENHDPTPRHALFRAIYAILHPLPQEAKRLVLDQLSVWANSRSEVRAEDRPLSADELMSLEEGGVVEVGAHTVSHPVLSALPAAVQRDEIIRGRVRLEEILGHAVTHFSYPHGRYSDETVGILRSSGFASACSSRSGFVNSDTDSFQLPRMQIGNWNGQELGRRLATFL
jgi:peptidoglycan/xylan/chitin deacetylase (PgdA/CDA1 family)